MSGKKRRKYPYNIYTLIDGCAIGAMPNGVVFYFDAEDLQKVKKYKWTIDKDSYVVSTKCNPQIKLHRYLLNFPKNMEVDHANLNPLDNRKTNLRIATHRQNSYNTTLRADNTSGYRGVYFDRKYNNWYARIYADGQQFNLGRYSTPEEAAQVRDKYALKLHGEFAWLNFPYLQSNLV